MATATQSELVREHVEALPVKAVPLQLARATAPPDNDSDEVVENHEFVLFPTADASFKPLMPSASAVTDTTDYASTDSMDTTQSFSRSNSVAAVASAAMTAAGMPLSPAYKMSGNAVDIIAVRSTEDQYFTTPWHVRLCVMRMHVSRESDSTRSCVRRWRSAGRAFAPTSRLASATWSVCS